MPELVLHDLTGRQVTEFSLAARTGAYHVGEHRYLPEVAAAIGVSPDVFAEVAAAGAVMGRVSEAAASRWGLPAGIPVTIAGHDHLVARAGAGGRPCDLVNSVGTAESVVAGCGDSARCRRRAGRAGGGVGAARRCRLGVAGRRRPCGPGAERRRGRPGALGRGAGRHGLGGRERPRSTTASSKRLWTTRLWTCRRRPQPRSGTGCSAVLPPGPGTRATVWLRSLPLPALRAATRLVVCGGGSRSRPWLHAKAVARPGIEVWRSDATEAVVRGAALYAGVAAGWWAAVGSGPQPGLERVVI